MKRALEVLQVQEIDCNRNPFHFSLQSNDHLRTPYASGFVPFQLIASGCKYLAFLGIVHQYH